ncbi:unnamed protein product [Brachionus calyciflorus]|uniref:Uncharacterized protein n=1 Tax=Brachionus calyciflorus TaxID=104777 RepID=A0A814AQH6_9BILA|nr:unnamed protein product [Brachionus calyciflorus]
MWFSAKIQYPLFNRSIKKIFNKHRLEFSDFELNEWLNKDANDAGFRLMTDEEIIQESKNLLSNNSDVFEEESENEELVENTPSSKIISSTTAITKKCSY